MDASDTYSEALDEAEAALHKAAAYGSSLRKDGRVDLDTMISELENACAALKKALAASRAPNSLRAQVDSLLAQPMPHPAARGPFADVGDPIWLEKPQEPRTNVMDTKLRHHFNNNWKDAQ